MSNPPVLITGEALVDFIPQETGPLESVETFSRRVGGAAANVAVTVSKLGYPPLFWTRLGRDSFGDFVAESLSEYGVKMRFIERDPDAQTALSFISHDDTATPTFSIYREGMADTRLSFETFDEDALNHLEWVYAGGVQLSAEPTRTATFELLEAAAESNAQVVFDPNARPTLWDEYDFEATVEDVLPYVDIIKTSTEDLEQTEFSARTPDALASSLCDRSPHTAFVTAGERGSYAHVRSASPLEAGEWHHDGFGVDVVDTTGAGDAFTGGVIASALGGSTHTEAILERANAIAALSTTKRGALSALPDRETVADFLTSRPGTRME